MFKRAERTQAKIKGAITGPSGSGKTFSALLVASGMGRKIAVIDTENGSASLYADKFQFDTLVIEPPYTIQKYVEAIQAAEASGYEVLVIDSITHAWAGDGGLLAKKESLDARGGNSFANWGTITKEQESFKGRLLNANLHILCTMRSKQDYVLEINDKGKSSPKKVGLAPIQRDGFEYEFTFVLDLAMNHEAQASKDRTGLFDGKLFKPSQKTGETIMAWLAGGQSVPQKDADAAMNYFEPTQEKDDFPALTAVPEKQKEPIDETFEIGKKVKGQKFSETLKDKRFLIWVNEQLEKDYAKTHAQLKRFHKFAVHNGAYKF